MPSAIAGLIAALRANDVAARQQAAEQLAQLGEEAQAAALPLVEACGGDAALRDAAAAALESLGPPSDKDVDALAHLLARPQLDVAYWAATLLGRLQGGAAPAVAALAEALARHPELAVRERSAWALGKIGPGAVAAKDTLTNAAASPQSRLAHLASEALQATQK